MTDSESLFHIVDAEVWAHAVRAGEYQAESLRTEGFIHCSFANQVDATVRRHYAGVDGLIVVELDPARISAPIVVEDSYGGGDAFPHIYGAVSPGAAVRLHGFTAFRPDSDAASLDP